MRPRSRLTGILIGLAALGGSLASAGDARLPRTPLSLPALASLPADARALPLQLPFARGACFVVTQGNQGSYSHHERSNRYAWDFAMPTGTPIAAAAAGRVVPVPKVDEGIGKSVVLDHGGGLYTLYAHLSHLRVRPGERVGAGQIIAASGRDTGVAPHLHFGAMTLLPSLTSLPARLADSAAPDGVPKQGERVCARGAAASRPSDTPVTADAFIGQGILLKTAPPAHALVMGKSYKVAGVSARPFSAVFYQVRSLTGLIYTNNAVYSDARGRFSFEAETPLGRPGEPVQQVIFSDLARQGTAVSTVVLVER
ncbi:M23 family metallopeptidase [Gloeobacter morelensis]|uniref:M23 family metallopeptidase n=1 Tax=Gloeobacter morelensis MG652769 TaxID=2781736 RepID=A0ABY3PIW8_9CYAN|nr:M23 family metallopeptidase [Gloeobacter morelensis]UFP93559.1 M23 family metallopeptidase [Gloeobacter morelensis MG652769]